MLANYSLCGCETEIVHHNWETEFDFAFKVKFALFETHWFDGNVQIEHSQLV